MGTDKKIDELLSSNYDGIQEYDNDLPRWWLYLFYITIVIALIYPLYYHMGPGLSEEQIHARDLEVEQARAPKSEILPDNDTLLTHAKNAATVTEGKGVYATYCVACHLAEGQGLVGPNLTDKYWIHGGTIADIYRVIHNGVLDKGMLAWKSQLSKEQLIAVTSYVWSLRGTTPSAPKAPQGDLVE